jgi:hypothetical protein
MKKTTIEIDEGKVEKVMKLGGFKTRKEAVDWALTEAVRLASINRIAENPWTPEMLEGAIDPDYDIIAIRNGSVRYSGKQKSK